MNGPLERWMFHCVGGKKGRMCGWKCGRMSGDADEEKERKRGQIKG